MKNNISDPITFEMFIDNGNSFIIKKVYPDNLSQEEIEQEEKDVPTVILHCFDPAKVLELQAWGEKIARQHMEIHSQVKKSDSKLYKAIRSIIF